MLNLFYIITRIVSDNNNNNVLSKTVELAKKQKSKVRCR